MKIPPLNALTADGSLHSSTQSDIFQGLPTHVLPSFQDVLICLSDYLSQCRIAIIDSTSMQIFNNTISTDDADSVITVPFKDKSYSIPITKFTSASVIKHASVSSPLLPTSSFSPAYVVRNYETAHFSTKRQLVRFFYELFGHPSLVTMLSIISSDSIVHMHPDLTPTAVRKFFPYDCPACPACQLAQRHQASLSIKSDDGEVIDRGSTAGGSHLNPENFRRALRLRRYARQRSCFFADLGNEITSKESTLFAPARSIDSKGKLFDSLTGDKINKREDVISCCC